MENVEKSISPKKDSPLCKAIRIKCVKWSKTNFIFFFLQKFLKISG